MKHKNNRMLGKNKFLIFISSMVVYKILNPKNLTDNVSIIDQ